MVSQLCHVFLCLLPITFKISFDDKETVMASLDAELLFWMCWLGIFSSLTKYNWSGKNQVPTDF